MPIRNDRSTGKSTTQGQYDELLCCRMAMLGLDLDAIAAGDNETFEELTRRCASCDFRKACAVDLKRDPNNPVWKSYCPNSSTLNVLTETLWVTQ